MNVEASRIVATAARLKRLYTAAVYDILDELGIEGQCLDLAIKPIDRARRREGSLRQVRQALTESRPTSGLAPD